MTEHAKTCTNCGRDMRFMKREHVQLGKTSWLFGDWPNLLAGALDVGIWCCPECGKLDFYCVHPDREPEVGNSMAQVSCPHCGCEHDLDDPKCPYCGEKNTRI